MTNAKPLVHNLMLRKLEMVALDQDRFEPLLKPGEHPPCFDTLSDYEEWLEMHEINPAPPRTDFLLEPNYCTDCTAPCRQYMVKADRCLFPETIFKEVGQGEDLEVVGYSPQRRR